MSFSSSHVPTKIIPEELYTPLVEPAVFDNIVMDQHSLDLIEQGEAEQRYAVVGFIDKEDKQLHLYARPSFTINVMVDDAEEKQEIIKSQKERSRFNSEDIVEAPSNVSGIVHHNTLSSIREYFTTRNIYIPHLKSDKIIGLSFRKHSTNILNWLSHSTLNYNAFDTNPVASSCFHFMLKQNNFTRPKYLAIYHLQRTLEPKAFHKIRIAVKEMLLKKHGLTNMPADEIKKETKIESEILTSNVKLAMGEWPKIRGDKSKIAEHMTRTIYYASGLLPTSFQDTPFQPENCEVIHAALKTAKEYNISLNVNDIPPQIKGKEQPTAFIHACMAGDLDSAYSLLDYADKEEKTLPLTIDKAQFNNNALIETLFKYCHFTKIKIETIKNTLMKIKENITTITPYHDDKEQKKELSKIINMEFDSKTALMVAMDMNHLPAAALLIEYSLEPALEIALSYAIIINNFEMTQTILDRNIRIRLTYGTLLTAASTGNVKTIRLIMAKEPSLLSYLKDAGFNDSLQDGMFALAREGNYLGLKELQAEYKIDLAKKYNSKCTISDNLFLIFIEYHVARGNITAIIELQRHTPDLYKHFITKKTQFSHAVKYSLAIQCSVESGQHTALKLILEDHKDIHDLEKNKLMHDCLVTRMIILAKEYHYNEIFNLLSDNPSMSVKDVNSDGKSIRYFLYHAFRENILDKSINTIKSFAGLFPNLYPLFLNHKAIYNFSNNKRIHKPTMTLAMSHSSKEIINFLLKNSTIDLEEYDYHGNTLLLQAAQDKDKFSIVLLLLSKGSNIKAINREGKTIADYLTLHLVYFIKKDMFEHVGNIYSACKKYNVTIDFTQVDQQGNTIEWYLRESLLRHIYLGSCYAASLFEKYFPDFFDKFLNYQNQTGDTAIMVVAAQGNTKMFNQLIDKKIDLDKKNMGGDTVLSISASNGNIHFVKKLLDKKANQDINNDDGLNFQDCLMKGLANNLIFKSDTRYLDEIREFEKHYPGIIDYNNLFTLITHKTNPSVITLVIENMKMDSIKSFSPFNNVLQFAISNNQTDVISTLLRYGAALSDITIDKTTNPYCIRLKNIINFKEQDDKSARFHALLKLFLLKEGDYETILPIFQRLDEMIQRLNAIPDCKVIYEMTKKSYQLFINDPYKANDIVETLFKDMCKFNKKLTTSTLHHGIRRVYTSSVNLPISIKLEAIIKKFNSETATLKTQTLRS